MMRIFSLLVLFCFLFQPLSGAQSLANYHGWSPPAVAVPGYWVAPGANGAADRVVFLDPDTSSGDSWYYDRRILVAESSGGVWGQPVVIGSNAINRPLGLMPIVTHPVISADGNTLAYLGCRGGCKPFTQDDHLDIYVSRRTQTGWSEPVPLYIDISSIDERISLNADGTILAFSSDYLNFPFYKNNQVYVIEYVGGAWGTPQAISSDTIEGWSPELSYDGLQVVWISNPPVVGGGQNILMTANRIPGGTWSSPQPLAVGTDDMHQLGFYRFTPDGTSLFYWMITLTVGGNSLICSSQDLYRLRKQESGWSAPEKVTADSIVPMRCDSEAPPALDEDGSRVIYPRTVVVDDMITSNFLEMVEYRQGAWTTPTAITTPYFPYYAFPNLSTNGARMVSSGPDTTTGAWALVWMETQPVLRHAIYLPLTTNGG